MAIIKFKNDHVYENELFLEIVEDIDLYYITFDKEVMKCIEIAYLDIHENFKDARMIPQTLEKYDKALKISEALHLHATHQLLLKLYPAQLFKYNIIFNAIMLLICTVLFIVSFTLFIIYYRKKFLRFIILNICMYILIMVILAIILTINICYVRKFWVKDENGVILKVYKIQSSSLYTEIYCNNLFKLCVNLSLQYLLFMILANLVLFAFAYFEMVYLQLIIIFPITSIINIIIGLLSVIRFIKANKENLVYH
jgi:hypothetical protein